MRVLLVPSSFHGAEGVIARYIAGNCKGIDVFLFKASDLEARRSEFLKLVTQVDVIHWIMNLCNIPGLENLDWSELPCASVASIHHIMPGENQKINFAQKANLIHVDSDPWMKVVLSQVSTPVSKVLGGVDYPRFSVLQNMKTPGKVFKFGIFGILRGRKRVGFFRDALVLMKSKNYQVIFQGEGWEKEKKIFEDSGINVQILGYKPFSESWKAYGKIDCYVCSSDIEGGPLGILEALSSGVPVVSTNVGLASEVLSRGGGIVTDINDLSGFSQALERMMTDRDYYLKCSKEGIDIGKHYFQTIADDYYRMYSRAIDIRRDNGFERQNFKKEDDGVFKNQRMNELTKDLVSESLIFFKKGDFFTGLFLWLKSFFSFRLNFYWLIKRLKFGCGEFVRRNILMKEPRA